MVINNLLYDGKQTMVAGLHLEVLVCVSGLTIEHLMTLMDLTLQHKLREDKENLLMTNIFDNPAHAKICMCVAKRIKSSVKGSQREFVGWITAGCVSRIITILLDYCRLEPCFIHVIVTLYF